MRRPHYDVRNAAMPYSKPQRLLGSCANGYRHASLTGTQRGGRNRGHRRVGYGAYLEPLHDGGDRQHGFRLGKQGPDTSACPDAERQVSELVQSLVNSSVQRSGWKASGSG